MRSELEQREGRLRDNEPCNCAQQACLVCRVFGPHKRPQHSLGPARIVVRDAQCMSGGEIELKSENVIDRRTGTAMHPRKVERVVAGSDFGFRIGVQVWDLDEKASHNGKSGADALVEFVKTGMRALRQTGLGSGVSKGSGEIDFRDLKVDDQPFTL
jgi:CRISPR-associated protein Csm3